MKLEYDICELGKALKIIEDKYGLEVLIKSNLSGGWMTISGKAEVEKYPGNGSVSCSSKKDNIIDLKVNNGADDGFVVKITGAKDKKFLVDISAAKYREISPNNLTLNMVKTDDTRCKLRIDEDIIFNINDSVENIIALLKNQDN